MAERILQGKLKEINNFGLTVASAGLIEMYNMEADPIAVKMLSDFGFDGANHYSRLLTDEMVTSADMVIAMETVHADIITNNYLDALDKTFLLKSFACDNTDDSRDIKDPYKLSLYHYRNCFLEISVSIDGLMLFIQKKSFNDL